MPAPSLTVEEAAENMPEDLRVTLALLASADDDLVELTLLTLPFRSRTLLVGVGVIDPISPHDQPNDHPVEVRLTEFGREVIDACYAKGLPEDAQEKMRQLEKARERRAKEGDDPVMRAIRAQDQHE